MHHLNEELRPTLGSSNAETFAPQQLVSNTKQDETLYPLRVPKAKHFARPAGGWKVQIFPTKNKYVKLLTPINGVITIVE